MLDPDFTYLIGDVAQRLDRSVRVAAVAYDVDRCELTITARRWAPGTARERSITLPTVPIAHQWIRVYAAVQSLCARMAIDDSTTYAQTA